jgi:SWI/SNF-related matrix-associated actin-dependent regulator 1 of chromatin subfamily A
LKVSGPHLKFIEGQFFLTGHTPGGNAWVYAGSDQYITTNFQAAAAFRRLADVSTERVFKRAFNRLYDCPSQLRLPSFLDPHQKDGVEFILTRARSYLAHAPGAGKTAQAIVAAHLCEATGQILFIVPPSLATNWVREIQKFSPEVGEYPSIAVVPLTAKRREMNWQADVIVCPDSLLMTDWVFMKLRDLKSNFKFIAVDEASRLKDPASQRSIAFYGGVINAKRFSGIYHSARHTVFLDGSPMPNRPMELFGAASALDPEAIDCLNRQDFGFRYCGAKLNDRGCWEFNGSNREAELHSKLTKRLMHVVSEDKLSHPERRRSMLFMTDVRTAEHKTWDRKHLAKLKIESEENSQGDLARLRRELGIRKVPWVAQYASEILSNKKEAILVFAWHVDVCLELEKRLAKFKPRVIIGGVKNDVREEAFASFQSGGCSLIIGNIQAMGRGVNLQRATRVVFAEFSWSPESNVQAEKRTSRRGNNQAYIRSDFICVPSSIDEKVLSSIFTKERRVKNVIG